MPAPGFAAIDFGTSNSAIALPVGAGGQGVTWSSWNRAPHHADGGVLPRRRTRARPLRPRRHGRLCRRLDGRLMRSMKSVLGSSLIEQSTDVGGGRAVKFPTSSPATCAT
jgi:hypothetical chaperone protein